MHQFSYKSEKATSLKLLLATLAIIIYHLQKLASLATATFLTIFYELHPTRWDQDGAPLASHPRIIFLGKKVGLLNQNWCRKRTHLENCSHCFPGARHRTRSGNANCSLTRIVRHDSRSFTTISPRRTWMLF